MISAKIMMWLGAILGALIAAVAIGLPAHAATGVALPQVSAGKEMVVVIDAPTGKIISMTATSIASVKPDITHQTICNTGWECWFSGKVPYANQGFYGSAGKVTGSWPYRNEFWTGNYTAGFSYSYAGTSHSYSNYPPNYAVVFAKNALVTGTSATIQ
jgi:hypothetical protein